MSLAPVALLLLATITPGPSEAFSPVPPAPVSPSPTASPCFRSLKFGGALYLDTDQAVPASEVGEEVGATDPNPAVCGLPDRLKVYRHTGHNTSEEVVYHVTPAQAEVFRSSGQTGYPLQDLLKWVVLALVVGIVLFAALPAVLAHLRQPPIEVGDPEGGNRSEVPTAEVGSGDGDAPK
ncbi:MAG: hypothetical protein M3O87_03035 [Candidatus Dormibacteraeota bacterium]|nr:hypothetical protein [Candidatus Dormibacteraeota bacterium]